MEVSKCWKIVEFPKIPIKMKNCKTFHEVQTASRLKEIIQSLPNLTCPPPQKNIKSYYVSGTETFLRRYTEIFRHIQRYTDISLQSASRMQFLGIKKWCSANVFSDIKQRKFAGKLVKWEEYLALLREHIIFSVKWVEVRKVSEGFWAKLHCKWVIFSASFRWLWDFLLENLKLKKNSDNVHWNVWTNIKELYAQNNIFKKRIPNMRFESFIFWSKFRFLGDCIRVS